MSHRFVICIDVDEESLEDAYEELYLTMSRVDDPRFMWESTDEAYDSDGKEICPDMLTRARMKVFAKHNEEY